VGGGWGGGGGLEVDKNVPKSTKLKIKHDHV
jgi:hypothetical protein